MSRSEVLPPDLRHPVDVLMGDPADAVLERTDVLGQEPRLGQHAVLGVVGRIHLHQSAEQVRAAAGHLPNLGVALDRREGGRAVARAEQVVLA